MPAGRLSAVNPAGTEIASDAAAVIEYSDFIHATVAPGDPVGSPGEESATRLPFPSAPSVKFPSLADNRG